MISDKWALFISTVCHQLVLYALRLVETLDEKYILLSTINKLKTRLFSFSCIFKTPAEFSRNLSVYFYDGNTGK